MAGNISFHSLSKRHFANHAIVVTTTYAESMLRRELKRQVKLPWRLNTTSDPNLIFVDLQMDNGVLRIYAESQAYF